MLGYIRNRLFSLIIVLIGVTMLSFIFSNISSVDPAEALARRSMLSPTPKQIEEIRKEMGLNLPIYQQYLNWLWGALRGELGISLLTRNPVAADLAEKLPATFLIVGLASLWIIIITVPLSILSALKKGSFFDHTLRMITIFGISIPNFWLGFILLVAFAIMLPFFKVVDYGNFKSLILPSFTIAIPMAASSIRLLRATILANMNKDFVIYAKARGISNSRIIWQHILKNSLPPMITVFCQYLGYMIAGSAIVETVFSWPGIGSHLVNAIIGRDLPTINGCVLVIAVLFVFFNLLADLVNSMINPKMLNEKGEF
ncbi:MAG: ABC transporter permease [Halanaerobiales bacterium]|nr:ABC transporter permease [Halanaerobiales bacterium]